jgi:hypothetical protein
VLETVLSVLRRFLSGQPLFVADSQHIHHKLLERGFSQQKVVVILYAVSAGCGMLSLFLLYPSGPMVGIVLFVIGTGIWLGVQHLGYHEFFELGRVALRTLEQKKIIVHNLAIRRATEAMSKANSIDDVRIILRQAFEGNDFDGFELNLGPSTAQDGEPENSLLMWERPNGNHGVASWTLTLDLKSTRGESLGSLSLYRKCTGAPLLVDINLLISGFNIALAKALERVSVDVVQGSAEAKEPPAHRVIIGNV